jgi:DNA polymerase III subunit chi
MTRIDFYFNVTNKPQLLAELVQAALNKRRQVTVLADNAEKASDISASLWQHEATSFIPNVLVNDALATQTPIIVHWQDSALLQDDMLINLTETEPSFFSRFTHLVELVSDVEEDKVAARARYKFYRDRGYEIKNINHAQT